MYSADMARRSQERKKITEKRTLLSAEMERLETELEKLKAEDFDLAIAEKVLDRLSGEESVPDPAAGMEITTTAPDGSITTTIVPDNMTVGDMAMTLLRCVGDEGMTSGEILESIRQRWLPTLARTSLSPPLSRLKQRGQIVLDGDKWKVASRNGPPERSGGPETGEGRTLATPTDSKATTPNG